MKNKTAYFDGLRVIACLMVITIHVFASLDDSYSSMSASTKVIDAVFVSASRAGVGLFFMISGALMISNEKNESIRYVFKYRFMKIIKLIIISKLCYLALGKIIYHDRHFSFLELINGFTNNGDFYNTSILWFLYVLAGLYLCLPLLVVLKNKSEKYLAYLALLVFFNVYIRDLFEYLFDIKFRFDIPMATSFLGIFIVGYFLATVNLSAKLSRSVITTGLVSMLIIMIVTYQKSITDNKLNTELWNDLNLLTLLMCSGIFVWAKNSKLFNNISRNRSVNYLASLTLIVYIVHYFVLHLLMEKIFDWNIYQMHTKNFIALWSAAVFMSFGIACILKWLKDKIVKLKKKNTAELKVELLE